MLARFRLAFAPAPALYRALTFLLPSRKKGSLLLPYTRRIILQKARRQAVSESRRTRDAALRLLVSAGVQRLFHPPPGVLFTFPSRYWFTIGGQEYSRLGGWSPQLPTGFLVPRGTQDQRSHTPPAASATGLSPAPVGLPRPFAYPASRCCGSPSCEGQPVRLLQPRSHDVSAALTVWAPARFARHYYGPLPRILPRTEEPWWAVSQPPS